MPAGCHHLPGRLAEKNLEMANSDQRLYHQPDSAGNIGARGDWWVSTHFRMGRYTEQ